MVQFLADFVPTCMAVNRLLLWSSLSQTHASSATGYYGTQDNPVLLTQYIQPLSDVKLAHDTELSKSANPSNFFHALIGIQNYFTDFLA